MAYKHFTLEKAVYDFQLQLTLDSQEYFIRNVDEILGVFQSIFDFYPQPV
jgi:hypothetical protein